MKNIFIIITVLFLFDSCNQSPEYGKKILNLNNFDFKLNLDQFFRDENIFRLGMSDYSVLAKEQSIDEGMIHQHYMQYSTRSVSKERPLASFAGVKFESLELCSDQDDEKVLLVSAQTNYATPADIVKIVDRLIKELGEAEIKSQIKDTWSDNYKLILKSVKQEKVGTFSIKIPFMLKMISDSRYTSRYFSNKEDEGTEDEQKKEMFTSAIYQQLKDKMKEMKEVECTLSLSKADFYKALDSDKD